MTGMQWAALAVLAYVGLICVAIWQVLRSDYPIEDDEDEGDAA